MKRATTLKVLAGTLVLTLVVSAFPLAQVAEKAIEAGADVASPEARGNGRTDVPTLEDLPFIPSFDGLLTPAPDGVSSNGADGASSRPSAEELASLARADASSSVLLSQILGAAEMMGYDVAVPALPVDQIASDHPLRAAILAWVTATGSVVPADELARELARADALPLDVQRDVALLLLSTIEASELQRAALASLTPAQQRWIAEHPEIAADLAAGIESPETRLLAVLAAQVDIAKSLEATLLLLQAVDATRGSFQSREAAAALGSVETAELDASTKAMLSLLLSADPGASDAEKVRLAARLVAVGAGIELPAVKRATSFADSLAALTAATGQSPAPADVASAVSRASALPDDLELALAQLLLAEADAIRAADPARLTPTSQQEALVAMLLASADVLPVLEKYALFWRDAPDALRMGEWEPSSRIAWAAHHAALFSSTNGGLVELARASAIVNGAPIDIIPTLPQRSFGSAYYAAATAGGAEIDAASLRAVEDAAARLDPAVRDAATVLLVGAAESARLHRLAFEDLSAEEQAFLVGARGIDELYAKADITDAELATLSRAAALAARVDSDALWQSAAVGALAMQEAQDTLAGRGAYSALATRATPVETGLLAFLKRLLPFGSAQAQGDPCAIAPGLVDTCGDDVLLRLHWPTLVSGFTPAEAVNTGAFISGRYQDDTPFGSGAFYTCDERQCVVYGYSRGPAATDATPPTGGEATTEMLVITGSQGTRHTPPTAVRYTCPMVPQTVTTEGTSFTGSGVSTGSSTTTFNGPSTRSADCKYSTVMRYGAPTITLDLGGDDTYAGAVSMVHPNASLPVSFHLDLGGSDTYGDPSNLYDAYSPLALHLGSARGHPTTGAAPVGGVAIAVDSGGDSDNYVASSWSQGYARLGFGLLADLGGTADNYDAQRVSQGAASDTFTLGAGILLDVGGADSYVTGTGQGYGLGGVLLDASGRDTYRNDREPNGAPLVALDIIPGGDVTTLDERADGRVWLDGPGSLSAGLGVDTELTAGSDRDPFPDFVEFLVGTDPDATNDSPITNPAARAEAVTDDGDGDLYPDYIERALSSDPNDARDYPAGFPAGPGITIPSAVWQILDDLGVDSVLQEEDSTLNVFETDTGTGSGLRGHDKIVDLRLPLQDAGTVEYACTGTFYGNSSLPITPAPFLFPGGNMVGDFTLGSGAFGRSEEGTRNVPDRDASGKDVERCIYASYEPGEGGEGTGAVPATGGTTLEGRSKFTYKLPTGILAIGDVVNTTYEADYFVVVDLGGPDVFTNSAGGALPVMTTPIPDERGVTTETARSSFWAPTLVVNVDLRNASTGIVAVENDGDVYANDTRDYAMGSLFGVLIDNAGDDTYVARDASQGALGGLLLDLDGVDRYKARDLSQGAGLAGIPVEATPGSSTVEPQREGLPGGGNSSSDSFGQTSSRAHRRVLSGMLLDLGEHDEAQTFLAHAHSQGFARGFAQTQLGQNHAPHAQGILVSMGGDDAYVFDSSHGTPARHLQGVGGTLGLGLLLDRSGTDTYDAPDLASQGSTISQLVGTNDRGASGQPQPATGILIDLADADDSMDSYQAGVKAYSQAQHQSTKIERSESTSTNANGRLYGDLGILVDTTLDPDAPEAFLAGIGGSGGDELGEAAGFLVDMPSARLAIGSGDATTYTHEYAFVVDLGGANAFNYSAAGFLRDLVAQANHQGAVPTAAAQHAAPLSAYPVTFLLDASNATSTYTAPAGLAQGAGFFSVGVLADLGGRDHYSALDTPLPAAKSAWLDETRPSIDGAVGTDWEGVDAEEILLVANDTRFESAWQMRIANDNRSLYLALEGMTTSNTDSERADDRLILDFDIGRRHNAWDGTNNHTGIDEVVFTFDADGNCIGADRGFNNTPATNKLHGDGEFITDAPLDTLEVVAFEADCRSTADGRVVFEMRKDLVRTENPASGLDLDHCWQDDVGFGYTRVRNGTNGPEVSCEFPSTELGLYVQFDDAGAGWKPTGTNAKAIPAPFAFPAGAQRIDGGQNGVKNGNLSDEMAGWAAIGLANGKDGIEPIAAKHPSLSQGAGLAGVGVLAMLGPGASESVLVAADRAQAYGAFGGLGALIDVSGSDRYVGTERVQGAAESQGLALLLEIEGNDNFVASDKSYGWVPATPLSAGQATFIDLGGDDQYTWRFLQRAATVEHARAGVLQEGNSLPSEGNNLAWSQNTTGVGVDYRLAQTVRDILGNLVGRSLIERALPELAITVHDPDAPDAEAFGNGCTTRLVATEDAGGSMPNFRASGLVCFVAKVQVQSEDRTCVAAPGQTPGVDAPEPVPNVEPQPLPAVSQCIDPPTRQAFAQLRALAGQNAGIRAEIDRAEYQLLAARPNVTSVDFMLDRQRVASPMTPSRVLDGGVTIWSAPVDLSDVSDGVKRAKAAPIFETRWDNRSVLLFADAADNPAASTSQLRTLVVDNVPAIEVALEPAYTGRANATFSPFAYGRQQQLYVNWSVSHDASEDRLAKYNGMQLQAENMSFPCAMSPVIPYEDQPALCHQLTFFLPSDDTTLTTDFSPNSVQDPSKMEVETIGGTARYSRSTEILRDPLLISTDGSFHLALPNRTALLPIALTTEINILLQDDKGVTVKNGTEPWVVAGGRFTGGSGAVPNAGDLTQLFNVVRPTVLNGIAAARGAADNARGNVVANVVNDSVNVSCSNPTSPQCTFLRGDVTSGQFKPCQPEPEAGTNLPVWAVWYATQVVERGGTPSSTKGPAAARPWPIPATNLGTAPPGGLVCRNYESTLREDVAPLGSEVGGATDGVFTSEEVQTALALLEPNTGTDAIDFTDFWFDTHEKDADDLPATLPAGITISNGALVIPAGYKLVLDFDLVTPGEGDGGGSGPGATLETTLRGIADIIDEPIPDKCAAPLSGPVVCNFNVSQSTAGEVRNFANNGKSIDQLLDNFGALPAAVFFPQSGGRYDHQARLEVRVPAEQTTDVSIALDDPVTGERRLVLRDSTPAAGDVLGSPTRWGDPADGRFANATYWNGIVEDGSEPEHRARINWTESDDTVDRWTQHNLTVADPQDLEGVMLVNITARDRLGESYRTDTVLIDRTAPQTWVTTQPFLGKALLPRGNQVPIRWQTLDVSGGAEPKPGSGIKTVYVYYREGKDATEQGDVGEMASWKGPVNFTAGQNTLLIPNTQTHYLMMTIGEDLAGNVEGTQNLATLEEALAEAFDAKIGNGPNTQRGYAQIEVDLVMPRFSDFDVAGGRLTEFEGAEFRFTRSGQEIAFSVCANDAETGVESVKLLLDHVDPFTQQNYGGTYDATDVGGCGTDGRLFVSKAWHLDNTDSVRFPEGLWAARFVVSDHGGNKIDVPVGNLVLDHRSPSVTLEAPLLPAGQSAVKVGDLVKVRLSAEDTFGVSFAEIVVDASSLSKNASAKKLSVRPVRVNGVIYQEAQFVVDRETLQNAAYDVIVSVPDLAGNATIVRLPIAVNVRAFEFVPGSIGVSNVTHNSFVLHWNTTDNTTAMAKLGTTSLALTSRTPVDANVTTQHALLVENLLPSTRYFVRAVSASTGGLVKESDMVEVETRTALFLQPTLPAANAKVSGLVKVAFQGGLLDSADFVSYTLEVRDGPTKPWTFVTTATRQGASHELTWNSTRFLDGTTYELKLTAEAGRDVASAIIGPITSDNTPASVLVISPLLATNDTTPRVMVETADALAGLSASPATLLIDGVAVESGLVLTALPEGRVRIEYDVPAALPTGLRTFELRIEDRAGNVAREIWKVSIDGEMPSIVVNPTRFAPGTAAAKTGGTVTLNLTVTDASGISLVTADVGGLSSIEPSVRLVKIAGTNEWQGTFVVTAAEAAATKVVTVKAVDLAGNLRETALDVRLDNVAPELGATEIVETKHTRVVVKVPSNEPILITGVAKAPLSPTVTLSTTRLEKDASLAFAGLLPSRTYSFTLKVTDAAGNEVPLAGTFATLQDTKAPSGVGTLSVLDLLNGTLRIGWTAAADDVGVNVYRVYRGEDNVTFRVVGEVKGTSYDDVGLAYEKPYVYKVAAVDHGANEGPVEDTLRAAATAVPSLSVGLVAPTVGTVSTPFRYTITYVSPGGVPAAYVRVILDGVPQNMTLESGDALTGAVYVYETRLAPHKRDDPHTYTFEASDGRYTVVYPDDQTVMRGPLVSGDALGGSDLAGFASFAQKVPLGGVAGLALAMVAAVGLAALARKKKEGSK